MILSITSGVCQWQFWDLLNMCVHPQIAVVGQIHQAGQDIVPFSVQQGPYHYDPCLCYLHERQQSLSLPRCEHECHTEATIHLAWSLWASHFSAPCILLAPSSFPGWTQSPGPIYKAIHELEPACLRDYLTISVTLKGSCIPQWGCSKKRPGSVPRTEGRFSLGFGFSMPPGQDLPKGDQTGTSWTIFTPRCKPHFFANANDTMVSIRRSWERKDDPVARAASSP